MTIMFNSNLMLLIYINMDLENYDVIYVFHLQ